MSWRPHARPLRANDAKQSVAETPRQKSAPKSLRIHGAFRQPRAHITHHTAVVHELATITRTWALNSIVMPGGGTIRQFSPSGSTGRLDSDDGLDFATGVDQSDCVKRSRRMGPPSSSGHSMGALEPQFPERRDGALEEKAYIAGSRTTRTPVGSGLDAIWKLLPESPEQPNGPWRGKWRNCRQCPWCIEPVTMASSAGNKPTESRDAEAPAVCSSCAELRRLEKLQPEVHPEPFQDQPPPISTVYFKMSGDDSDVVTPTDEYAALHSSGYFHVPAPSGYGRFGPGVVSNGASNDGIKHRILDSMTDEATVWGMGCDISGCDSHDGKECFAGHIWEEVFKVPAAHIHSVVPCFLRFGILVLWRSLPRFDLVALLVDGEWVRFHPSDFGAYVTWPDVPDPAHTCRNFLDEVPQGYVQEFIHAPSID